MTPGELVELVRGVELLCLDAGNTVIFLDHARLARWLSARGWDISPDALVRTEGVAKLQQERGELLEVAWKGRELPGAAGWGKTVRTIVARGRSRRGRDRRLAREPVVRASVLEPVVAGARGSDRGYRRGARARSQGGHREQLSRGCSTCSSPTWAFSVRSIFLLDSGKLGVYVREARPAHFPHGARDLRRRSPSSALHLGDSIATDVLGARDGGPCGSALIDPHGHLRGARSRRAARLQRGRGSLERSRPRALVTGVHVRRFPWGRGAPSECAAQAQADE